MFVNVGRGLSKNLHLLTWHVEGRGVCKLLILGGQFTWASVSPFDKINRSQFVQPRSTNNYRPLAQVIFEIWVYLYFCLLPILVTRRYGALWSPTSSSCGGLVAFGHLEGPLDSCKK